MDEYVCHVGNGEDGIAKETQIEHWFGTVEFIPDAKAEAPSRSSSQEEGRQCQPSQVIPLVEDEQQPGDGCCQGHSPHAIETLSWRHTDWLLHPEERQDDGETRNRHTEIKHC